MLNGGLCRVTRQYAREICRTLISCLTGPPVWPDVAASAATVNPETDTRSSTPTMTCIFMRLPRLALSHRANALVVTAWRYNLNRNEHDCRFTPCVWPRIRIAGFPTQALAHDRPDPRRTGQRRSRAPVRYIQPR